MWISHVHLGSMPEKEYVGNLLMELSAGRWLVEMTVCFIPKIVPRVNSATHVLIQKSPQCVAIYAARKGMKWRSIRDIKSRNWREVIRWSRLIFQFLRLTTTLTYCMFRRTYVYSLPSPYGQQQHWKCLLVKSKEILWLSDDRKVTLENRKSHCLGQRSKRCTIVIFKHWDSDLHSIWLYLLTNW